MPGSVLLSLPSPGLGVPGLSAGWSMASDIRPWEQVRDALAGYSRAQRGGEWRRRTKTKVISVLEV